MLAVVAWCAAVPSRAAEPTGVVTLLEGEAVAIIGARVQAVTPGLRVPAGTMLETDAATGILRVEWPDGSLLDLGPATRAMLRPVVDRRPVLVYLLQGWVKQTQASAGAGQLSPAFDVAPFSGVLVSQVDDTGAVVFSEAGGETLVPRRGGQPFTLKAGQAGVATAAGPGQAQPRPPAGWLARVPRAFRDTIAPRAAQFKGPPPAARFKAAPGYATLRHWLVAEAGVRREFPQRFEELLADRAFRDAVASNLAQHPEWETALRPPRPAATARRTGDHNTTPQEAPR